MDEFVSPRSSLMSTDQHCHLIPAQYIDLRVNTAVS